MLQIRPGDLVAIKRDGLYVLAAVLSGGHWCFVAHHARYELPKDEAGERISPGFNALVDFIVPKREGRIVRLRRSAEFSSLCGSSFNFTRPRRGEFDYRRIHDAEHFRSQQVDDSVVLFLQRLIFRILLIFDPWS